MMDSVQDALSSLMLQATGLQHWSRGAVLDSSRVAVSGDSEMTVNDLRAQSIPFLVE